MRIPLLSAWLEARRFDRDHRPFLTPRLPDPVRLPDGQTYQPELQLIWCWRHGCWFNECPA